MNKFYLLIAFLMISLWGFSGEPIKAVGIRAGLSSGFEYRVFSTDQVSYKALLSFRKEGLQLTGMKEFHVPNAFDIDGEEFTFVYGFGAHAGFESWYRDGYYDDIYHSYYRDRKTGPIAGLDALAAIEYSVREIPFVFGLEVKPYFNVFGEHFLQIQPFDFAFTIKYTF